MKRALRREENRQPAACQNMRHTNRLHVQHSVTHEQILAMPFWFIANCREQISLQQNGLLDISRRRFCDECLHRRPLDSRRTPDRLNSPDDGHRDV